MKDITGLDMIQHNHSLVVIRNLFTENKQKFLVYYDEKWDCKLFLNYKTMDRDNENSILDRVAADLGLNREEMEHDENIEKKNMEVVDFVKESIQ